MFSTNNQHHISNQPYCNVKQEIFDNCVNKIFFDHVKKPDKSQQMATIEIFKKYQDTKLTRGYGTIGFKNLINDLDSSDPEVVEFSLEKLENEMKNKLFAYRGMEAGILRKLYLIIHKVSTNSKTFSLALKILNLIAKNFFGSQLIAENDELMKKVLEIINSRAGLEDTCLEILQALSENPSALQILLQSNNFTVELQNIIVSTSTEKFFSVLSNFIALKPEIFAKIEIFNSLINNISKSKALKCLALILDCDDCKHHAIEMKIENILLKILIETCDDETKTYAIMAFRHYLTYKNIYIEEFPWKRLLIIMMENSYTKINGLLQESCIHTIRIMSDDPIVKKHLRKIHMTQIRNIPSLTFRSKHIKADLLEWLKYKSYKNDNTECEKYSKLLI